MAETEIKSINGRTLCDAAARKAAEKNTSAIEQLSHQSGSDIDLSGYVRCVNGIAPDENGNVVISVSDGSAAPGTDAVGIKAITIQEV